MRKKTFWWGTSDFLPVFLCKLCQLGHEVWHLVLPSPHACTSLHNFIMRFICRRPHSCRQDRKTHESGCKMCLVMTGYESGYTRYKNLAIAPFLGFCSCLLLWLQRYFPLCFLWEDSGWLLGVSDVADWCKVHRARELEVVTKQLSCITN